MVKPQVGLLKNSYKYLSRKLNQRTNLYTYNRVLSLININKQLKLNQAGIDGVGEYCGEHCVSQSTRRSSLFSMILHQFQFILLQYTLIYIIACYLYYLLH